MSKTLIPKSYVASIDRALHNLYTEKSTTFHPMTAVPIYFRRMFRGDKFNFGIVESILRSEPTYAPLLANWRLQFQWYFDSDANRYGWIDNNTRLTSQEVMDRRHHTTNVTEERTYLIDDFPISSTPPFGKGGISDYAGIAPGYTFERDKLSDENNSYGTIFNIDFHLTYLNIIRNYHVNKQFPNIPYLRKTSGNLSIDSYSLDDMDNLFMFLRSCPNGVSFNLNGSLSDESYTDAPYDLNNYYQVSISRFINYLKSCEDNYGGLFCTQFEPDLYQNLLAKDQNLMRSMVSLEQIDGSSGITIEQFRLKNHLQGLYDKIFVSGGSDRDLSRTIWGIESNRDYDIPELLCVHSEIIGTNLITSSTAGESGDINNVPGSMAGNINTRRGAGRIQKFTAKTSGNLMCIVTLTPIVTYNQNIERHLLENNFMDEFTPDMARKGFEKVPMSDYCVLPDITQDYYQPNDISTVVGTQVAWLREMSSVNRAHGEFSAIGEKQDWILRRDFTQTEYSEDGFVDRERSISVYGNPLAFQYPFVSQTLLDPNFYLQVAILNKAYRPVPRRFMPNLGF